MRTGCRTGTRIVFEAYPGRSNFGDVYVVDADGQDCLAITTVTGALLDPKLAWE